jgi:fatty acid desaturase
VHIIETIIILVALLSMWPLIIGYEWAASPWYKFGYLAVVLIGMIWVTVRRMTRVRAAADEAKRKRDESARTGRPPWVGG